MNTLQRQARALRDISAFSRFNSLSFSTFCLVTVLVGCGGNVALEYVPVDESLPKTHWISDCLATTISEDTSTPDQTTLSERHDINFQAIHNETTGWFTITSRTYGSDNCSGPSVQLVYEGEYQLISATSGRDPYQKQTVKLSFFSLYQAASSFDAQALNDMVKNTPTQLTVWEADKTKIEPISTHLINNRLACPAPKTSLEIRLGLDNNNVLRLEHDRQAMGFLSPLYNNVIKPEILACLESIDQNPVENADPVIEENEIDIADTPEADADDVFSIILDEETDADEMPPQDPYNDMNDDYNDDENTEGGFGSIIYDIGAGHIDEIENDLLDGLLGLGEGYRHAPTKEYQQQRIEHDTSKTLSDYLENLPRAKHRYMPL